MDYGNTSTAKWWWWCKLGNVVSSRQSALQLTNLPSVLLMEVEPRPFDRFEVRLALAAFVF